MERSLTMMRQTGRIEICSENVAVLDRQRHLFLFRSRAGQQRTKRAKAHTLADAHRRGQLVRIQCQLCSIARSYQPADLERLVGAVDLDGLTAKMRCEKCGKRDYLGAHFCFPTGQELASPRIRRLVDIRMARKVIWRDEP
jgi:hypothetical protein